MSESQQPFTEYATRKKKVVSDPTKLAWIVAGIAFALMVLFLLLWAFARADLQETDSLRAKLSETTTNLANAQADLQKSQDQIAALQSQAAELAKEKEAEAQMSKNLENEMRSDLESKDVTISNLKGKLTVNILDRVMFDSGEAVLKPAGQVVMQHVGELLTKHPELKIHVIGHTDNVPIRAGAHSRFASNWELSSARALAAVHYLTEQAGVDPRRVGAVGYGEYRPIADNSTPEGRAKNRRIAITILPDELAAADTAETATNAPASTTNSPALSAPTAPTPAQ